MSTRTRQKRPATNISKARLADTIEEAIVDAYGESEQTTAWFTLLDENLAVPFQTKALGVPVSVERVDLDEGEQILAVCRRDRESQSIPILDIPMPSPSPEGAEWVEAYRRWRKGW